MNKHDEYCMKEAIILAIKAKNKNEVPVGAVLVFENNIIAKGYNNSISKNDPTAHAEIIVLRKAGCFLKNYRLLNTTLYVTLQPCIMCFGAILNSRICKLVYGANSHNYNFNNIFNIFSKKNIKVKNNVFKNKCKDIIKQFFKNKRK